MLGLGDGRGGNRGEDFGPARAKIGRGFGLGVGVGAGEDWRAQDIGLECLEAAPRFELGNNGFADRRLTTWLCRRTDGTASTSRPIRRVEYTSSSRDLPVFSRQPRRLRQDGLVGQPGVALGGNDRRVPEN